MTRLDIVQRVRANDLVETFLIKEPYFNHALSFSLHHYNSLPVIAEILMTIYLVSSMDHSASFDPERVFARLHLSQRSLIRFRTDNVITFRAPYLETL